MWAETEFQWDNNETPSIKFAGGIIMSMSNEECNSCVLLLHFSSNNIVEIDFG